jgi:3-oxoacyl-[acyl-carrier protein] reductase
LQAEIESSGGKAMTIQADMGDPAQVRAMVQQFADAVGPVDTLVNNAGISLRADLSTYSREDLSLMRSVNVDGVIEATLAVCEAMKSAGFGRIVNIVSVAGFGTHVAGTTFYASTKAAVMLLSRRFAMELGCFGITVNAVAPGFVPTEGSQGGRTAEEAAELCEQMAKRTMVRRVGTPEDIANAVAFLVSRGSGFLTGQVLTVDGGRLDYITHP